MQSDPAFRAADNAPSSLKNSATVILLRTLTATAIFCLSISESQAQNNSGGDLDALPEVPDGFRIEFAAREPLVRNPCSLVFDAQGRLCIGMGPQYRSPTPETPGDSVFILSDTNGDGVFDTKKRFATGFNSIQGLAWRGRDLWIANAPDLTVVRDLNGDDVADEYVRIFTDLGNLEHGLHGLNWGPDGRLYMSKGNSKGLTRPGRVAPQPFRDLWGVTAPDGTPAFPPPQTFRPDEYQHAYHDPTDDWGREGGVLASDDMGENLEIVSRGFRNPWDIAFDNGFNWQGTDNDQNEGDRVFTPFFGSHYGWGHAWSANWTGRDHLPTAPISGPVFHGSGTGITFYDATQFPKRYRGAWFFNDWLRRTVFFYRPVWDGALMQPKGGRWQAFVTGGNALFKPTDIEVGPDGSLYILGWGREYGVQWNDKHEQINEGRVFRVSWVGESNQTTPVSEIGNDKREKAIASWSLAELLADFNGPLPVWRTNAQEELVRRGAAVRDELMMAISDDRLSTAQQTWAVWTLARIEPQSELLDRFFAELTAGISERGTLNLRIQAIRILGHRARISENRTALRDAVTSCTTDEEPRIRFEVALAIRRAQDTELVPILWNLTAEETDRVAFYAQWQAVRSLASTETLRGMLTDSRPGVRRAALLSLAEDRALKNNEVSPLLQDPDPGTRDVAALWLAKSSGNTLLVVDPPGGEFNESIKINITPGVKPSSVRFTLDGTTPTLKSDAWRGTTTTTKSMTLKAALFTGNQQIGPIAAYRFEKISVDESAARSGVLTARAESGRRYRVVDGGLVTGQPIYTDRDYTFTEVPDDLRGSLIVQTSNDDSGSSGKEFLDIDTVIPVTLLLGYDTRVSKTPSWLAASGDKAFKPANATVKTNDATFRLYERRFDAGRITLGGNTDDGIDGGKSNYLVIVRPAGPPRLENATQVESVIALLKNANQERGKALFFATGGAGCAKCHRADGSGRGFGPDLSNLVKRKDELHIIRSILEPSREIKEGFTIQTVVLKSGRQVSGLLRSETQQSLTLTLPTGDSVVIPKSEVDERFSGRVSPMPSFDRLLKPQQVADLVAWLSTQAPSTSPPKPTAGKVRFKKVNDSIEVAIGDQPVAVYVYRDKEISRPYIAHVKTRDGIQVTRNHPPEQNDPADHPTFHPGIFLAFGDISGNDYWRLKARVKHDGFADEPSAEKDRGTFTVRNRYLSADGRKTVCVETCRYTFLVQPHGFLIDCDSTFRSDKNDFYFGDQEEMGIGVRVASPIRENGGNGRVINSNGISGARNNWGRLADWCDYSGTIDGRHVGVTIMASPDNVRPSWWHNRDYGVFVANLFGRKAMRQGDTSKLIVNQGKQFRLRYGIVVHSSIGDAAFRPEKAYSDYVSVYLKTTTEK